METGKSRRNPIYLTMIYNMQISVTLVVLLFLFGCSSAEPENPVVRIANLQIDVNQLESYKVALKEEIETAVRVEPGVLTLYAVSDKANPTQITVFEIYANQKAYEFHIETPHFKKYKTTTLEMVQSLDLIEGVPIALETK